MITSDSILTAKERHGAALHDDTLGCITGTQLSNTASRPNLDPKDTPQDPYTTGSRFTVWRHTPPAPFGHDYNTPLPALHPDPRRVLQQELCYSRCPREGEIHFEDSQELAITSIIRTGAGLGPQLVTVNDKMVAKIYDPMCYNPNEKLDAVWRADKAYSCEAAAYQHLQQSAGVQDIIPAFHGTWAFKIDTSLVREGRCIVYKRPVRLILIAHLKEQCMGSMDVPSLSELTRSHIVKLCLESEIRILHAGVNHGDCCPRNIMVLGDINHTAEIRVKLIDFDISTVFDHPNYENPEYVKSQKDFTLKWDPKLTSPIMRYYGQMVNFSFPGWCPGGLCGAERWLWQNYSQDDRYIPVQWEPEQGLVRPKYVDALESHAIRVRNRQGERH